MNTHYEEIFSHLQKTPVRLIRKGEKEPYETCFAKLDYAHAERGVFYRIEAVAEYRSQLEEACELMAKQAESFLKVHATPDNKMQVETSLQIVEISYMAARQDGKWSRAITTKQGKTHLPK